MRTVIARMSLMALALILFTAALPGQAHAEVKIGVVNFEKVVKGSEYWKQAKAKVEDKYKDESEAIEREYKELQKLGEELKRQSLALSREAKEDKQLEFTRKRRDFEDHRRAFARKLQTDQKKAQDEILQLLFEVTQEFGKKNGYTVIMDRAMGMVVYSDDAVEVTNDILVELNRVWRAKKAGN